MVPELTAIKDFILSEISVVEKDKVFQRKLDNYLARLIDIQEGAIKKNDIQLKAGRQLLCCIAIDIKSGLVPISHYGLIFKSIKLDSLTKEARQLFFDCINDNNYYYRQTERKATTAYCIVVFPIKDRDYYIDAHLTGIHSISTVDFLVDELIDYAQTHTIILKSKILDKGSEMRYFWATIESEIDAINTTSLNPVNDIVDRLGLSHFDFKDDETKFFCYFNLAGPVIETYKPNATVVNWAGAEVGFLSYIRDEAGRTFSISGYSNYKIGLKERIFKNHHLTDAEQSKTSIKVLKNKISIPIKIEATQIIEEGLTRFNLA
jgi:hypothetical protein